MALAAAVTVTAVPVDALAASPYAKKMARHQAKQAAAEAKKSAVSKEEYYKAIDILVKIPEDVTVDVPLTDADDPATDVIENKNEVTFSDPAGTVTGDPPADENDKNYDYTEVTQQGKVTIETTDVTITETEGGSDMDYVSDETDPSATNDLVTEIPSAAPEDYVPTGDPENGYQYEYAGTGSTSQLRPARVFTEPMTDE